MKDLFADPVILISCGVMLMGIIGLFWGIAKFRRMKSAAPAGKATDELFPAGPDLRDIDFRAPTLAPAATVSKDVAERLDSMTQRLSEMQSVLMKQSAGGGAPGQAGTAAGGLGQGFSPETIDKLLKIIGNVIQQVDILQKSMNMPKDAPATKADAMGSPFTKI
jgi:hypothetical protein